MSVTFVHLSDLHVSDPSAPDPTLLSDTGATLAAVMARVRAIEPKPSFAVVSGDLTNRGDRASYGIVRDALAELGCPAVICLGNHDEAAAAAAVLPDLAAGPVRERVVDGIHAVAIDTNVPGRIGGALGEAAVPALAAALDRHPELPKILVLHHGPALDGDAGWKTLDAESSRRLSELVRGRGVAALLTGHIHVDRVAIWAGVPVVTVSGQHATIDSLHGAGLRSERGASFALCGLGPAGFSATFIQMPSDRAELERLSPEVVGSFA